MTLFNDDEIEKLKLGFDEISHNTLVTFRQQFGPTRLQKLWTEVLHKLGVSIEKCVSWWSSTGTMGLLECEKSDGTLVLGQWVLDEKNELLGVFDVSIDEVLDIRDGFDAANVQSAAMRAYRIGETGQD